MRVFLRVVGLGKYQKIVQNYFSVKSYKGPLPNHYIKSNKPLLLLTEK